MTHRTGEGGPDEKPKLKEYEGGPDGKPKLKEYEGGPDERPKLKEYEGEGITVTFEPRRCLHAAECVHGLPEVFDPSRHPWVLTDAAGTGLVAEAVRRRPSGALRYHPADGSAEPPDSPTTVRRTPSGRLVPRGDLLMAGAYGERQETRVVPCGCGASGNQPYCDHSGPCAEPDDDLEEQR
ncbi:(4Fe-4S)-binding protein [Streptomyces sp. Qhu_M48]|uniref:(4Fe-4S)-binding protein n=1 Tax=Streptomyces sp. Qhu_M48 TaxID=3435889 RepID=UPI003F509ED7